MTKVTIGPDRPRHATGPLVVPVAPGGAAPDPARAALAGFSGAPGQACCLGEHWLVALGADPARAGARAAARLQEAAPEIDRVVVDARALSIDQAIGFLTGLFLRVWRYDRLRTTKEQPALKRLDVMARHPKRLARAWAPVEASLQAATFARDLVAEPSDTLTPQGFVARLQRLAQAGVEISVLDRHDLRREGLGGLLAVGGGSVHPPALAVLRWRGGSGPPVVFVGKGITFDTGGLCIKPAAGMEEMRADMAGAAACAGAMLALALRGSRASACAVLALAENATGGASYRPGDVLRLADRSTVEVVDTDAEGRLVLADALAWSVRRLHPAAIIDLATLTGSIVVALGGEMAGLFSNDAALAEQVAAAGSAVGEQVWPMPIGDSHAEDLASAIADVRHCVPGRGQPDACHAAAFLRPFVGQTPWVHLDIAGMESRAVACDRFAAGASGFGVRLLDRLVLDRFEPRA